MEKEEKAVCMCMYVCVRAVGGGGVTVIREVKVNNEEPGSLTLYWLDLAKFISHASILQDSFMKPTIFKKHLPFKG